jgi:hypothetical protein
VQGQAGPSWQDGADGWILTYTVVRFLGRVKRETERERIFFGNQARPLPAHLSHSLLGIAETDGTSLSQRRVRVAPFRLLECSSKLRVRPVFQVRVVDTQ